MMLSRRFASWRLIFLGCTLGPRIEEGVGIEGVCADKSLKLNRRGEFIVGGVEFSGHQK